MKFVALVLLCVLATATAAPKHTERAAADIKCSTMIFCFINPCMIRTCPTGTTCTSCNCSARCEQIPVE
ncbi:hypothetical protein V1264_025138 [Littorina saxatilis]|uniref:Uncharacterized protein n=1 Tax=Littorina saxatilis TaxID=31220 RepID=A0AAN9FYB8_9CAEN